MTPDSRFFVWDLQNETITMIAFPGQFITQLYWDLESNTFLALELKAMSEEILAQSNSAVYSENSKLVYGSNEFDKTSQIDGEEGYGDVDRGTAEVTSARGRVREMGQGDTPTATRETSAAGMFEVEDSPPKPENQFATVFHTKERGIVVHSKTKRDVETLLMGLEVPHLVLLEGKGGLAEDVSSGSGKPGKRKVRGYKICSA